jgi:tRNA(Arg) A34 adenosine deaminase TadA
VSRIVLVDLPAWAEDLARAAPACATDEERMRLAVDLARENVLRGAGGPFGAAIFEEPAGRLVAAGVNAVTRLGNSVLHAEVVAIVLAEARVGSHTLRRPGGPDHCLVTSCDPCAMCLGAALWSGVRRIVCGAGRNDAAALGFEEGPVFDASWKYLEERGIAVTRGVMAAEARAVLALYREAGGVIYNG